MYSSCLDTYFPSLRITQYINLIIHNYHVQNACAIINEQWHRTKYLSSVQYLYKTHALLFPSLIFCNNTLLSIYRKDRASASIAPVEKGTFYTPVKAAIESGIISMSSIFDATDMEKMYHASIVANNEISIVPDVRGERSFVSAYPRYRESALSAISRFRCLRKNRNVYFFPAI